MAFFLSRNTAFVARIEALAKSGRARRQRSHHTQCGRLTPHHIARCRRRERGDSSRDRCSWVPAFAGTTLAPKAFGPDVFASNACTRQRGDRVKLRQFFTLIGGAAAATAVGSWRGRCNDLIPALLRSGWTDVIDEPALIFCDRARRIRRSERLIAGDMCQDVIVIPGIM